MKNPFFAFYILIIVLFIIGILFVSLFEFNKKLLNKISLKVKLFFYISLILTLMEMIAIILLIYFKKFFVFDGFFISVFLFFMLEWLFIYLILTVILQNLKRNINLLNFNNVNNIKSKSLESLVIQNYLQESNLKILQLKDKLKNYLTYIPTEYYNLLVKNNKKPVEIFTAILVVDIRSSFYYSETVSLIQNYEKLAKTMKIIVDKIVFLGGVVDGFAGDGILCMFESSKQALLTANTILNLSELKNKIGIAIHYGKVQICEIGGKERKTLTAISSEVNKTFKIEKINKKLGTNILFTKQFLNSLPPGQYNYRYVGSFLCDDGVEKVSLFESLLKNKKNIKTIEVFENAVRKFEKGKFSASKGDFLTVYNKNKDDLVALFYLNEIKKIDKT